MFVGREEELKALEDAYGRAGFQMVVVYGRRRVGKTTLLDRFARGKRALYFTAQEESGIANLRRFSRLAYESFGVPATAGAFSSWSDALEYVASEAAKLEGPSLLVLDEFPYAAQADPSLPSELQIAIDHSFKGTNVTMVLCGSNEGFMESEVLGSKSPLYGRRAAQIRLRPLDCMDVRDMLPGVSATDVVRYYATFGGTPYYVEQVDVAQSYDENVARLLFSTSGLLYAEPSMLLRQELREPALYNSVLSAVARGMTTPKGIAERAGVERVSVGRYLRVLVDLGILERRVPFGTNPDTTRRASYAMADPFFSFWYRFVGPSTDAVELGAGAAVAREVASSQSLPTYEGTQFERVCMEWLARRNAAGSLPFLATSFGRWWGTDPQAREQADIDVIAANRSRRALICGECKWRNSFDESGAIRTLEHRATLVDGPWDECHYYLFTKREVSEGTRGKARARDDLHVVTAEGMLG